MFDSVISFLNDIFLNRICLLMMISFIFGVVLTLLLVLMTSNKNVHEIKRFCPYLQAARDMYNALQKHFDENIDTIKLKKLKIKKVDDKCHMVICKYKSLKSGATFTI